MNKNLRRALENLREEKIDQLLNGEVKEVLRVQYDKENFSYNGMECFIYLFSDGRLSLEILTPNSWIESEEGNLCLKHFSPFGEKINVLNIYETLSDMDSNDKEKIRQYILTNDHFDNEELEEIKTMELDKIFYSYPDLDFQSIYEKLFKDSYDKYIEDLLDEEFQAIKEEILNTIEEYLSSN